MDIVALGHGLSVWLIPVVVAITFHEAAHGWMAERCGDNTARLMGRVSFNPIKHVDPIGTLALPGILLLLGAPFLFGYAKPVPVRFDRLRRPKRDMVLVAIAGPAINIVLAFAAALALHAAAYLPGAAAAWVGENLANAIIINVVLAVFNMLPVPPLDGGRVVTGLLPDPYAWQFARLERYGLVLLIGLLIVVPLLSESLLGTQMNPLLAILWPPVQGVYDVILTLTGLA